MRSSFFDVDNLRSVLTEENPDANFMAIKVGGRAALVVGGPFNRRPEGMRGFCAARELTHLVAWGDMYLLIPDFGVPGHKETVDWTLKQAFRALIEDGVLYVGCAGGRGRTGLVMALLAKATGRHMPVDYVRATYHPNAVETDEQCEYVRVFDVGAVRRWLRWQRVRGFLHLGVGKIVFPPHDLRDRGDSGGGSGLR